MPNTSANANRSTLTKRLHETQNVKAKKKKEKKRKQEAGAIMAGLNADDPKNALAHALAITPERTKPTPKPEIVAAPGEDTITRALKLAKEHAEEAMQVFIDVMQNEEADRYARMKAAEYVLATARKEDTGEQPGNVHENAQRAFVDFLTKLATAMQRSKDVQRGG